MEYFREFTYWFVGINIIASVIFSLVAIIFGARDLYRLINNLMNSELDEADDGRVE